MGQRRNLTLAQSGPLWPHQAAFHLSADSASWSNDEAEQELKKALRSFQSARGKPWVTMDPPTLMAGLEGLAKIRREPLEEEVDRLVCEVSMELVELVGGAGLARLVSGAGRAARDERAVALRVLAALWFLPEALGRGETARWFADELQYLRWPRYVPDEAATDELSKQEVTAAAAAVMARCGAWKSARLSQPFQQVLAAHLHEDEDTKEVLSQSAAALWLCAWAQSGLPMAELESKDDGFFRQKGADAEKALLETATSAAEVSGIDAVRVLWALHALGKGADGAELLSSLSQLDSALFSAEAWALLREVQASIGGAAGADEAADEGTDPWSSEEWRTGLERASRIESAGLALTGRLPKLRNLVAKSLNNEGEEAPVIEENAAAGPYHLALQLPSIGVGFDLDVHQSPVNRALRRQQWAQLLPDVRIAELSARSLDKPHEAAEEVRKHLGAE